MGDPFSLFLFLVLPMLVAAILVYLGILAVGLGTIAAAFRSAHPVLKGALLLVGLLVILSPALFHAGMEMRAQHQADVRQADLSEMPRTDLAGRLPATFIAVGNFRPELIDLIKTRYGLRTYPDAENQRLVEAYRDYRRAEWCHRRFPGNQFMPGTRLPKCRPLPDSVQGALGLREPLLVFTAGASTSMREDNIIAGEMYEIRLLTLQDDLLVAYYEERTVEETASIFNPYVSGRRNASAERPPTLEAFIDTAMQGASR